MSKKIVIIAGEPSGDFLGANLAAALRHEHPGLEVSGVGGNLMRDAGVESLFPYEDLAVMGVAEVVPALPRILERIRQTADFIKREQPSAVITVDAPDFCFRVIKLLRKEMAQPPKFIHYVAPTVWAWREGRAAKLAGILDGLICLFDFEPPYFERHGLPTVAVGHPMVESGALNASAERFFDEYGIVRSDRTIGVLFGSRAGEIDRVGKALRDAVFDLAGRFEQTPHLIAPTLPHIRDRVFALLRDYPGALHIVTNPQFKYDAFATFDVALAVSGTVGLELAAMKVPHVIAYKMNPVTAAIVKKMVRVKYAHLANIMLDREVVPEFIQNRCRGDMIAEGAYRLLERPYGQIAAFEEIRKRIGAGQEKTPSEKAAAFVSSFL